MKILIDARLFGPKHTGNGRYTMNLVQNLAKIDIKNKYILLLRKENMHDVNLPINWTKIEADFRHYSIEEQIKLPFIIMKFKPDLVHFPHFNVPLLYFGKFVVTIHDLIMHKFSGNAATTRSFLTYLILRLGYYIAFAKAVYGSAKIIVPSKSVKSDLISYYPINENKVNVIYEA